MAGSIGRERVYKFVVPSDGRMWGYDIRAQGVDSDQLDLVLELRKSSCSGDVINCADDSTPPGGYGSRLQGELSRGTYLLVVDGFAWAEVGSFKLSVNFVPDCQPECEGHFCGSSGCDSDTHGCGTCDDGQVCAPARYCVSATCVANCTSNTCGDDGCGGSCGICPKATVCVSFFIYFTCFCLLT